MESIGIIRLAVGEGVVRDPLAVGEGVSGRSWRILAVDSLCLSLLLQHPVLFWKDRVAAFAMQLSQELCEKNGDSDASPIS